MAFTPVRFEELFSKLGIGVTSSGYFEKGCPFCGAKGTTSHVSFEKQQFHCFRCKSKGQPLGFYTKYVCGVDLPADKGERKKFSRELQSFMGYDDHTVARPRVEIPEAPKVLPASDTVCHAVYSAMASLAMFQLSAKHKQKLKARGLSGAAIEQNGYRTLPYEVKDIPAKIKDLYASVDPALKAKHNAKRAAQVQMGLYVAHLLIERGHKLDGVPGFYKFGDFWCLTYMPGMMIPTRNIHGEIVRWQVRMDYGDVKYKTLSCSYQPGAVTENVSRCHFPIKNAPLSKEVRVIFTEGPLKADVAISMTHDPVVYAAIHGINNGADLLDHCEMFKQAGITEIYNALDMDRLTNPSVREGSAKLDAEFQERGMNVIPMYWAGEFAAQMLMLYQGIAYSRGIRMPSHHYRTSVYEKLNLVADALNRSGIDPGKLTADSDYWEPATKGIDDYMYSNLQRKARHHTARTNHIQDYHNLLSELGQSSNN